MHWMLIIIFVLCACAKTQVEPAGNASPSTVESPAEEKPPEPEGVTVPTPAQEVPPPLELSFSLTAETEGLPSPNQYQINLKWESNQDPTARWILHRKEEGSAKLLLALLPPSHREYVDPTVTAGHRYEYSLETEEITEESIYSISVPTDTVLVGARQETEIKGRRVFLDHAQIQASASGFMLEAEELYSIDSRIESIPSRNPGAISIRASQGTGTLNLLAQGENGTAGADGRPGREGNPGNAGVGAIEEKKAEEGSLADFIRQENKNLPPTDPYNQSLFKCKSPPGDGEPGENAGDGENGQPGSQGGNTPPVSISVAAGDLNVTFSGVPGLGGNGGQGGRPGVGGAGGPPGNRGPHEVCPNANPGPKGRDGIPGTSGTSGADGTLSPYCIRIADRQEGYCP